jgi:hypothetical protein
MVKTIGELQHDAMVKARLTSIDESLKKITILLEVLVNQNKK